MKIYANNNETQLIYVKSAASSSFWDQTWFKNRNWIETVTKKASKNNRSIKLIKKFTPQYGSVIEGGCGMGQFVYGLHREDYKVVGIDFAKKTVNELNTKLPELDIRFGDVRNLSDISNASFDAYYSGGVIEHFWEGYSEIFGEMERIIKPNGVLIITFPFMSKARKKLIKGVPKWKSEDSPDGFYQFALNLDEVIEKICMKNFRLIHKKSRNGIKGYMEAKGDNRFLNHLYSAKSHNIVIKALRYLSGDLLSLLGYGHTIQLVFKKNS